MRVWKQWTDSKTRQWKVTSTGDDRHLLRMAINDRTSFSRQLAAGWFPLTANYRRLRLQWAHEHRSWQSDWHQVVFSYESRFNFWDHDGRIRVRRYAEMNATFQSAFSNDLVA
ncbi:transposable element Tc1 transposase [Trichonephila clavipes]|nr:transposable element Tc1 transposase [Trichonephila clavipes]